MTSPAGAQSADAQTGFAAISLRPELQDALQRLGYEEPTPIQLAAIPTLIAGRDVVGQAATGTGKTAAFALPMLNTLEPDEDTVSPRALVLVPTRELAIQVAEATHRYGRELGARVTAIYGGQAIGRQLSQLRAGTEVVIATPGRAIDHINRGSLKLDQVRFVVLDEADEMLDMGFAEDIDAIMERIPPTRQTALFSATIPSRVKTIAKKYLTNPEHISISRDDTKDGTAPRVRQCAYVVTRANKPAVVGRVVDAAGNRSIIVFCRTRDQVDHLCDVLNSRGYRAEAIHGGMTQEARDRVMKRLRNDGSGIVIATDVAARGLDIDHLMYVINYDIPSSPDVYTHRIGRVGRAGREGTAVTLVEPREHRQLQTIERSTGTPIAIEPIPTVIDISEARAGSLKTELEAALQSADLTAHSTLFESLNTKYHADDICLAAIHLLSQKLRREDDDLVIPHIELGERPKRESSDRNRRERFSKDRKPRDRSERERKPKDRQAKDWKPKDRQTKDWGSKDRGPKGKRGHQENMVRIFVNAGRDNGVRAKDLVGAIANEAGIRGNEIGTIDITSKFSLVDIPAAAERRVIDALGHTTVRGNKLRARRDRPKS